MVVVMVLVGAEGRGLREEVGGGVGVSEEGGGGTRVAAG